MHARLSLVRLTIAAGTVALLSFSASAQSDQYVLVKGWPTLPAGMHFGSIAGTPASPDTTRAAKLRPQGADPVRPVTTVNGVARDPLEGNGVSGLAIDAQDHIYAFNRGKKPVLVFDRDGRLLRAGGDLVIDGRTINYPGLHSGGVDWEGNVYVVDRANARIVKFNPTLDKCLLQIGTTGVNGFDATHFDNPSGIVILRNGNIVVTDGYGNNRVVMFDKNGKFIKQSAKGAGSPKEFGTAPGEFHLPHKLAVDADENLYIVDRENYRIQIFDKNLTYIRELTNPEWNPWDIAISRKGTEGTAFITDHTGEQVRKISLKDGKILTSWGKAGRKPGEFDWVHGVVVDSQGAVYVVDTYGQQLQKFVPAGPKQTAGQP